MLNIDREDLNLTNIAHDHFGHASEELIEDRVADGQDFWVHVRLKEAFPESDLDVETWDAYRGKDSEGYIWEGTVTEAEQHQDVDGTYVVSILVVAECEGMDLEDWNNLTPRQRWELREW